MKNYYDILEISNTATKEEIKKGYFKMVRKYPPDKEEAAFKKIREAYEILSNIKTKQEYDEMLHLPKAVRDDLEDARQLMDKQMFGYAAQGYEWLVRSHPELVFLQAELAQAYLLNGNTGKAIKILESLVDEYKDIPVYRTKLGIAYMVRGWRKKALVCLEKAIKMDSDNIGAWVGLMQVYENGKEYNKVLSLVEKAMGQEQLQEHHYMFQVYLLKAYLSMEILKNKNSFKKEINQILLTLEEIGEEEEKGINIGTVLINYLKVLLTEGGREEYIPSILNTIEKVIKDNKELKRVVNTIKKFGKLILVIQKLQDDERFEQDTIISLVTIVVPIEISMKEERESLLDTQKMLKYEVAIDYKEYKADISLLKNDYPELYELEKEFFEKISDRKRRQKYINSFLGDRNRIETLLSMFKEGIGGWEEDEEYTNSMNPDEAFDEYPFDEFYSRGETYVREEAKVGRNEPCPCGSGKKYKKCCGKS